MEGERRLLEERAERLRIKAYAAAPPGRSFLVVAMLVTAAMLGLGTIAWVATPAPTPRSERHDSDPPRHVWLPDGAGRHSVPRR